MPQLGVLAARHCMAPAVFSVRINCRMLARAAVRSSCASPAAAGVAEQDVDGAEHGLHPVGREVAVGEVDADEVHLRVELGDDEFGDGLAGHVFGSVLVGDLVVGVACEAGGEVVEDLQATAEVEELAEVGEEFGAGGVRQRPCR